MTAPTPLHRDPDHDGDDYGCFSAARNASVAALVASAEEKITSQEFTTVQELLRYVDIGLCGIGREATDTVVRENVYQALMPAVEKAEIDFEWSDIYR